MLDLRYLREHPEEAERRLRTRDPSLSLQPILERDERRRALLQEVERLRHQRNEVSREIGRLRQRGEAAEELIAAMREVGERIEALERELRQVEAELRDLLARLPNLPHESVPVSLNKADNVVVREWGEKPSFAFPPRHHVELGELLNILDLPRGAKLAGSQFPLYKGLGAELEMALVHWMLDVNVREKGYTLIFPPILVNEATMFASGNLPKFEEQLYRCRDDELYLIPTAEVPLTGFHRDEILREEDLPLYYTAYTPCFRREAGTWGAEERGLIRVHQFNKVELYKFTTPETSYVELERLVADAEDLVRRLGLPYRVSLLVTGDLGQQSAKTYDIEVWLPAQGAYYEVSSCSNCEDYQARRGNIRFRRSESRRVEFVHTLNGSGLATPRLMVALLENYQQPDGSVVIPEVLRPYLGGRERIEPISR